ncbi:Protein OBERON 4, partial [Striga hermonthica]
PGIDYDETYSPIMDAITFRYLMSLAVHENLEMRLMDVVTAYLYGSLETDIYMKIPEGIRMPEALNSKPKELCALKLQRSLYGLKQSGRMWYNCLSEQLLKRGYLNDQICPCVFIKKSHNGVVIVAVYVDDLNIIGTANEIQEAVTFLKGEFEMKDLGKTKYCLGLQIERVQNGIFVHQSNYTKRVLKRFNMDKANPLSTPMVNRTLDVEKDPFRPCEENEEVLGLEEGELEPDPQPQAPLAEDKAAVGRSSPQKEANDGSHFEDSALRERESFLPVDMGDASKGSSWEEQAECEVSKDVVGKNSNLPAFQDASFKKGGGSGDENDITDENGGENNVVEDIIGGSLEEDADSTCGGKLSIQEQEEERGVDIKMKVNGIIEAGNGEITSGSGLPFAEKTTLSSKDKGKGVALLPFGSVPFTELALDAKSKALDRRTTANVESEGPSARGFQFFAADPVNKTEEVEQATYNKQKDDKLPLELSLSLPNVLLPIGAQDRGPTPGSPSHGRSIHSFASSFRTNSDGFTASMSFSGSQHFSHNPSCSLTHNALDFEQSVKSKPLFQGVDWKALAEESKSKEAPAHQGMSSRENGFIQQSQSSQGKSSGLAPVQNARGTGSSSKLPIALERQLSLHTHLLGTRNFGSCENVLEHCTERRQLMLEKNSGSLHRLNGPDEKEQSMVIGSDFAESIVTMIVSEPLHVLAKRFSDMTGKQKSCVKEFVLDMISDPTKQWQLSALQKALQKRPDVTLDMLLNAHNTQLEILVALKTGLREFLLQTHDIPISDLAEIFLNMRCRNLNCKSVLPVDECDCKICSRRSDFCRECMCLVCSKFDMASNTCSWVGCDVCLHWCHADCGLRESHIRNGISAAGLHGTMEMQFYCVACGHPSEMFGFVKEVFQNFVKDWTAENLARELEYVRRIFFASGDMRGKQLHDTAVSMLSKLANRSDLLDVQNRIVNFFNETKFDSPANITSIESHKELSTRNQEASNGITRPDLGPGWLKPVYPDKPPHFESSFKLVPEIDISRNDKYETNLDLSRTSQKEPIFDELESIVRIKHAEAKMFRTRAEDARKESEALKRIVVSKSERIEEEYKSRITKLRLAEAEEMQKQKLEELQAHEQAYQEYVNMKMRMETDIKDLLLKMEATRSNLSA